MMVPDPINSSLLSPERIVSTIPVSTSDQVVLSMTFSGGVPLSQTRNSDQNHGSSTVQLNIVLPVSVSGSSRDQVMVRSGRSILPVRFSEGRSGVQNSGQGNFSIHVISRLSFHATNSLHVGKESFSIQPLLTLASHSKNLSNEAIGNLSTQLLAIIPFQLFHSCHKESFMSERSLLGRVQLSTIVPVSIVVPVKISPVVF